MKAYLKKSLHFTFILKKELKDACKEEFQDIQITVKMKTGNNVDLQQ